MRFDSFTLTHSLMTRSPEVITPESLCQQEIEVFANFEDYQEWLNSCIPNLGNRKPANLINTEAGRRECYTVLNALLHGIFL